MHKLFHSQPTASQFFKVVAGKVIKATLVMKGADISASDEYTADIALKALMTGSVSTPWANLALDEATEADLIAAKSAAPSQTHEIDSLIKFLRATKAAEVAEPAPPIRVEIVNAEELAPKDTVLQVQRDESGKLTGAVRSQSLSEKVLSGSQMFFAVSSAMSHIPSFCFGMAAGLFIAARIARRERLRRPR